MKRSGSSANTSRFDEYEMNGSRRARREVISLKTLSAFAIWEDSLPNIADQKIYEVRILRGTYKLTHVLYGWRRYPLHDHRTKLYWFFEEVEIHEYSPGGEALRTTCTWAAYWPKAIAWTFSRCKRQIERQKVWQLSYVKISCPIRDFTLVCG